MSAAVALPAYARQVKKGDALLPESQRHYYKTPNMVDDLGMPPLAHRLYSHYRRVCGDHGVCRQSLRELAGHTCMSHTQVAREQMYLKTHGLISIRRVRQRVAEVRTVSIWKENFARYEKAPRQPERVCNGQLQTVTGSYHPPDPPIRTEELIKEPVKNTPHVSAHPARPRVSEPSSRVCPPQSKPAKEPEHKPAPSSRPSKFSADELRAHAVTYNLGPGWLTVALRSDRFDAVIDECRAREKQQTTRVSAATPHAPNPQGAPPEDPDLAAALAEYEEHRRELDEAARRPAVKEETGPETQKPVSGQICATTGVVACESAPAASTSGDEEATRAAAIVAPESSARPSHPVRPPATRAPRPAVSSHAGGVEEREGEVERTSGQGGRDARERLSRAESRQHERGPPG